MGKTKIKKRTRGGLTPTGLPSVKEFEADEELGSSSSSEVIEGFIEKLQSPMVEDRECGCAMIANLVSQPKAVAPLLKHNIVKILGPLMMDMSLNVRQGAVGTLRNLSVVGGSDICQRMVEEDVMTPLVALYKQYETGWTPGKCSEKKIDVSTDVFHQATHLLWNICENCETAVSIFNTSGLLSHLLPCLEAQKYGLQLAITTAQCLHTVTENNDAAIGEMIKAKADDLLMTIVTSPHENAEQLLLRTLATGILYNISCGGMRQAQGPLVTSIIGLLSEVLTQDLVAMITAASHLIPKQQQEETICNSPDSGISSPEPSQAAKYAVAVTELEHVISAQQLALEVTANLCCSEDDDDDDETWEDLDTSDASSEELFTEEAEDDHMEDSSSLMTPLCVSSEVHAALLEHNMVTKVLERTCPLAPDLTTALTGTQSACKVATGYTCIQTKALLCVNNMVSNIRAADMGGLSQLEHIWTNLSQLAITKQVLGQLDLLEANTSAMRAVIHRLAELHSSKFNEVSASDLQFLFDMGHQCSHAQVRANAIRIVSTIGCLLSNQKPPHVLLRNIGVFLLMTAIKDNELWVIAEALDAIFDVFGEDETDSIAQEIKLVEKLKSISPTLKTKINQQKKKLGEHLPIIQTARTNLVRFIKYKQTH